MNTKTKNTMKFKHIMTVLVLGAFVVTGATAQDRNELKGPKHKNYKPWKSEKTEKLIVTTDRNDNKGPEAKNYKPWKDADEDLSGRQLVDTSMEEPLKGPMRKNARP